MRRIIPTRPVRRCDGSGAFTLVELLVIMAIILTLATMIMSSLRLALEKSKVARVHLELRNIGVALDMYVTDYEKLPPVRVNCNSDMITHWCQLPLELAQDHYLPTGNQGGREANMEDLFNLGHTYKYAAPGPQLLNGSPGGNYSLWVPTNAPCFDGTNGMYFSDPRNCPVRWVVWSMGPRPDSRKSQSSRAPMSSQTWYRRTGDGGVIMRYAIKDGTQFKSP